MKYLQKIPDSKIEQKGLSYSKQSDRAEIRDILKEEQHGFCAYSEKYFSKVDDIHIEHFDGRLKGEEADDYFNWYAVLGWMNIHKPRKIENYLPILSPTNGDITQRIVFEDGSFMPANPEDKEANNLIKYLGFNKKEVFEERQNHLNRLRFLLEAFEGDNQGFLEYLHAHKEEQSFATAIEHEFSVQLTFN